LPYSGVIVQNHLFLERQNRLISAPWNQVFTAPVPAGFLEHA
jgi:hypothetical protein